MTIAIRGDALVNTQLSAQQYLDRDFLEIRCRLIDIAAAMDRIGRAQGAEAAMRDDRAGKIGEALRMLTDGQPDRAERVQMLFSDRYEAAWQRP